MMVIMKDGEKKCKKTSIGGQALIDGIMMRGPHKTSMAVRNPDGAIVTEDVKCNYFADKSKFLKLPFIRGIFGFIDSMKIGYKTLLRSAEISGEGLDDQAEMSNFEKKLMEFFGDKLWKAVTAVAMVLGFALSFFLFFYAPTKIFSFVEYIFPSIKAAAGEPQTLRSIFEGTLKILIFVCYILLISRMKEIKKVFQYHGAEHKAIFCYEKRLELNVENVRTQSRFHPRCGTSFLILMLVLGIIAGMFIPKMNDILRVMYRLAMLPLIMSIGYELLKLCGRHENFVTRIIATPGMWMQRLTTSEPDDSQIECAIAALSEVIPENTEDDQW